MPSPLADYLAEIGRIPLLTPAEEIELGHKVQQMMPILEVPEDEWTPEQRRIVRSGKRAKHRIITANLRLVVVVAKKYNRHKHLDLMDLIQEGSIGLNRAVEKFDPARGYKFSTYAYWWIRQGICRGIAQLERTIRLPYNSSDVMRKVAAFAQEFHSAHGRSPTRQECADHAGVQLEVLDYYIIHAHGTRSLDEPSHHASDLNGLYESIPSGDPDPIDATANELHLNLVQDAIGQLREHEQRILIDYYALHGGDPKSMGAISKEAGVSRERVRQIREKALYRVRRTIEKAA